jgi:hypothetical protein
MVAPLRKLLQGRCRAAQSTTLPHGIAFMIASEPPEHDVIAALFMPANRPQGFERAAASGADAAILDPEDAVSSNARRRRVPRSAPTSPITDCPVLAPFGRTVL